MTETTNTTDETPQTEESIKILRADDVVQYLLQLSVAVGAMKDYLNNIEADIKLNVEKIMEDNKNG